MKEVTSTPYLVMVHLILTRFLYLQKNPDIVSLTPGV